MRKTKSIIVIFGLFCIELIRMICVNQGIYANMDHIVQWQQWLLTGIGKISECGILVGLAAGCFYSELEETREEQQRAVTMITGLTIVFVFVLLGAIQEKGGFEMSYLVRMGSYFIFPVAVIFILKKMIRHQDVGGHLTYFWLLILLNMVYISLFQKTGELLLPFLIYQTILEALLIHWIFQGERESQLMLSLSVFLGNICIYNWYQGKITFLQQFPSLGRWHFEWGLKRAGILLIMLILGGMILYYITRLERERQILLLSSGVGAMWELFLKSGADGIFHMRAIWQEQQGIFLLTPFLAVIAGAFLIEEREGMFLEDEEEYEDEEEENG